MKIQHLLFSVLLLGSCAVNAEKSVGLIEIYQKAIEKDTTLAAELAAAKAAQEKETQSFALLLPTITANANTAYSYNKLDYLNLPVGSRFSDNSNASNRSTLDLQFNQSLFRLARHSAHSQSKIVGGIAQQRLRIAEQNLILRVTRGYFDILSASESLTVAKSQTHAFNENLERAKLTFRVGTATKTDKLEAQARYDLARASELSALNKLAIARHGLGSIIEQTPKSIKKLDKNATLYTVNPQDIQHWVDAAIVDNLNIKLSSLGVKNAQLEIKRLKNDRYPVLDLVASAGFSRQYSSFARSNTLTSQASVGLQFSVPLYTGGLMTSRIREAESLRTQQKYSHRDIQRQVVLQTQQAYLTALNGFQQVNALKQASISSESALNATRKGMEVGVRTNLDLLNAQQQFFETERDYSVAKYDYLLTILDLKAAAGNLSGADIESLNQLLEK